MSERVTGRCPACGSVDTLFVGAGGWITCSLDRCLNPLAVSDLLDARFGDSGPHALDANVAAWHSELMKKRRTVERRAGSIVR